MIIKSEIRNLGKMTLPDPQFGDQKLSVFPFEHTGARIGLPNGYQMWEDALNDVMKNVPVLKDRNKNMHYVTIDSRFFIKDDFLRREGPHVDGNFCVDPVFSYGIDYVKAVESGCVDIAKNIKASWGGATPAPPPRPSWGGSLPRPSWGGAKASYKFGGWRVDMDWVLPYPIDIPFGEYISENKGGLLCVSTNPGCRAWDGEFYGEVGAEGDFTSMSDQLTDNRKTDFEAHTLYFMTSNTPHETTITKKGERRTLLRVTLNHEYPNKLLPCMQEELA